MTKEEIKQILEEQLALDYDCSVEEIQSSNNIFRTWKRNEGARYIGDKDCMLKIAVYREKLLVMADDKILDWCKQTFENTTGTWLAEPESLIKIHEKLGEYGQKLADTHHHYLPALYAPKAEKRYDVKWYEQDEIKVFQGDNRFWEALLFDEQTPDMLAVCAVENDTILGMASVTRDCDKLWQIGVNVTEEGKGKGIGAYVTSLLKEQVMERGVVPFYSTVESHIKSQKVAFQAGFEPVMYELFSAESKSHQQS